MTDWTGILIAAIGALAGLFVFVLQDRSRRRSELRRSFASALADVYAWIEFPYRIRRRSPSPDARHNLAREMSDLQQKLAANTAWFQLLDADVHAAYIALVTAAKAAAAEHLRGAWESPPIHSDSEMTLGSPIMINVETEASNYIDAVDHHLRRYVLRIWV